MRWKSPCTSRIEIFVWGGDKDGFGNEKKRCISITTREGYDAHYKKTGKWDCATSCKMPFDIRSSDKHDIDYIRMYAEILANLNTINEYCEKDETYQKLIPLMADYNNAKYEYGKVVAAKEYEDIKEQLVVGGGIRFWKGGDPYKIAKVMANTIIVPLKYPSRIKIDEVVEKVKVGIWEIVK